MKHNNGLFYAEGPGFSRGSDKYSHNQWGGKQNPNKMINEGRGPTRGNQDHKPMNVGKPATRDAYRPVPTCHEPGVHQGQEMFTGHAQVRTPGGTRDWNPQAGQNYKGNPDRINVSGYSMGDGKMTKGGRPEGVATGQKLFNYGPKRQY